MFSASTKVLLFSTLIVLLQNANCLSVGQPCNILAFTDECDPGLTCVAQGTSAHCQSIQQTCDPATCPSVWCSSNLQYTPEGECCPICPPQPTIHVPPVSTGCSHDGHDYSDGEKWNPNQDLCTTCTCRNGLPLCQAIACTPLSCENTVNLPGQCCPVCAEGVRNTKECQFEDKVYQDGERWQITDCLYAICVEGEVLQYSHQCAEPECENPIYIADVCCPMCPESKEAELLEQVSTAAPVCMIENGETLNDGETYCPQPNVLGTCKAGEVEYQNHCSPLTCANQMRGQNPCDCPVCVDDAKEFEIAGKLDMPLHVYARKAQRMEDMINDLIVDAGFFPDYNIFSNCNRKICVEIHLVSPVESSTVDDVVQAVHDKLNSEDHNGLEIGYKGDFNTGKRSARSVSDSEPLSLSSSSTDRHSSSTTTTTTTVIAVTASVFGVIASVIGIALLASYVYRKKTHTITV